jgi:hypothetical protein
MTTKKFNLFAVYAIRRALSFAVGPMSIACLWVDPWLIMLVFPPCNFVVSGCRSLLNYGESTSPLHQIAKMTLEKLHLLIEYVI